MSAGMLELFRIDHGRGPANHGWDQQGDGSVLPGRLQRVPMRRFAHCVTLHPNNSSVFVAHVAPTAAIAVLRFNPDAAGTGDDAFLTLTSWIKTGDVRHLFFHPQARSPAVMYANDQSGSSVRVFTVDTVSGGGVDNGEDDGGPNGEHVRATEVSEHSSLLGTGAENADGSRGNQTGTVRVHPSGGSLFVTNRGHDSVMTFSCDASTGRGVQPVGLVNTGPVPRVLALLTLDREKGEEGEGGGGGVLVIAGSDETNSLQLFRGTASGVHGGVLESVGSVDIGGNVGWISTIVA